MQVRQILKCAACSVIAFNLFSPAPAIAESDPIPNIFISSISDNYFPRPDGLVDLNLLVFCREDQGVPTKSFSISVYLSDDSTLEPGVDLLLKVQKFGKLKASELKSKLVKIKKSAPLASRSGKYVLVVVDQADYIFESNESDNLFPAYYP